MKYDDASWHSGGDFPDDLSADAAATHTGMFLAWAVLRSLVSQTHLEDFGGAVSRLRAREITPGQYFLTMDGKLTDEDLSEIGNAFAQEYFDFEKGKYLEDYDTYLAGGLPSQYHVPDTWSSFDTLAPVMDERFKQWRETVA